MTYAPTPPAATARAATAQSAFGTPPDLGSSATSLNPLVVVGSAFQGLAAGGSVFHGLLVGAEGAESGCVSLNMTVPVTGRAASRIALSGIGSGSTAVRAG